MAQGLSRTEAQETGFGHSRTLHVVTAEPWWGVLASGYQTGSTISLHTKNYFIKVEWVILVIWRKGFDSTISRRYTLSHFSGRVSFSPSSMQWGSDPGQPPATSQKQREPLPTGKNLLENRTSGTLASVGCELTAQVYAIGITTHLASPDATEIKKKKPVYLQIPKTSTPYIAFTVAMQ